MNKSKKEKSVDKKVLIGICIAIGILIFGILLLLEKNLIKDQKITAVVSKKDILAGTNIKTSELDLYFKEISINQKGCIPSGYQSIKSLKKALGKEESFFLSSNLFQNMQLSTKMLVTDKSRRSKIVNPVLVNVKTDSYEQCCGGILRKGDYVDVIIKENSAIYTYSDLYIEKALDTNGTEITENEKGKISVGFNLLIEKERANEFAVALTNGKPYLVLKDSFQELEWK